MTMWRDLTMQLRSDLMQATGIFDPVRLRLEYDAYLIGTLDLDYQEEPNEYKRGGSIHIKHPGRLTALKKRTGKTEAELWATGNKDYRRMITFARNSRKWKHLDGSYLKQGNVEPDIYLNNGYNPEYSGALIYADNRNWWERNVSSPINTYFGNLSKRSPEFVSALQMFTPVGVVTDLINGDTESAMLNIGPFKFGKETKIAEDKFLDFLLKQTGKKIKRVPIKDSKIGDIYSDGFSYVDDSGKEIAHIAGSKNRGNNIFVESSYVDPEFRSKGLGKLMYLDFNEYAFNKYGTTLHSSPYQHQTTLETSPGSGVFISPSSKLWRGLKLLGMAEIGGQGLDKYFIMGKPSEVKPIVKYLHGGYLDGIIWDNMGLWSHPGLITGITGTEDGTDITMNGVADYLIGKDNLGNVKFMKPGMDYHFPGSSVVEYPLKYQFGGLFKKKETPNYLYTTYGLNSQGDATFTGSYNNPIFGYQPLSGINQSVGRDYSMPDYGAVAYTSYPIYMNPPILTGDTNKEALAKQYLANFVLQDGIENTMNSKYYDKKRDRWTPQDSVEGGAKTIGKGLKMNNTNAEWYKTLKKQGYLTNELMEAGVNEMIGNFYGKARDIYNNRVGAGAWDKLDANKQALLMDYAYNGVLGQFNNFMDAVAADDKDRILKEYVRYSGGKKLGKRNDETLNWINSIWPDTYQYGGLVKPFSYTDIPVVRYGFGGYSYI